MLISIIVAMDEQGVIGFNGDLPWHLSADLQHFKKITMGHPIMMGRKTHESIGRPLPGRENIVITRNENYAAEGCTVLHSPDEAFDHCKNKQEVIIMGGAELYKQTLEQTARLYLTEIHARVEGDTFFPEFDRGEWKEKQRNDYPADEKNDYAFSFMVLDRL